MRHWTQLALVILAAPSPRPICTAYSTPVDLDLEPGDLLALFTDGVLEAQRGAELYGLERLKGHLKEGQDIPAYQLIDRVLCSVREFIGDAGSGDDLTLSIVKVC